MAKITENASLVSLASTFTRSNGQPLDDTILFDSLTAAETYAQADGRAYVGQIISVIDEDKVRAYIIKDESGNLESIGNIDYENKNGEIVPLQEAVHEIENSVPLIYNYAVNYTNTKYSDIAVGDSLPGLLTIGFNKTPVIDDKVYCLVITSDDYLLKVGAVITGSQFGFYLGKIEWIAVLYSPDKILETVSENYLNTETGGTIKNLVKISDNQQLYTQLDANKITLYDTGREGNIYLGDGGLIFRNAYQGAETLLKLSSNTNLAIKRGDIFYPIYGAHNISEIKASMDAEGNNIISTYATKEEIGNITNIVNFKGVVEDKDTLDNPQQGDIVIEGSKEFIYDGSKWVELGDLTPAQEAIEDLQTQLDEAKAELKEYVDNNGTKTYSNFESLEADLNSGKLYKGQIVTVVDDYDAEAYIVFSIEEGKASVMPLSGSGSPDSTEVISEDTITDIISNNFESTPVTTKYSIKPGTINDIIDGTYEGGESNLDSEIDNIINPTEE